MLDAERLLLRHALKDPLNKRFILLSESCLFLHDYNYIYDFTISSPKSYVDSFREAEQNVKKRYNPKMSPTVPLKSWRKGSQWFSLTRKHAQSVARERVVYEVFRKHCKPAFVFITEMILKGVNVSGTPVLNCIPDEHYVAVLSVRNWRSSEVQRRSLTYSEWQATGGKESAHPVTFNGSELSPQKIKSIQVIDNIKFHEEYRTEVCGTSEDPRPCFLFARKFTKSAGLTILRSMPTAIGLSQEDRHLEDEAL